MIQRLFYFLPLKWNWERRKGIGALKFVEKEMTIVKSYTFKVIPSRLEAKNMVCGLAICSTWDKHCLMFKFYFIDYSTYKTRKKSFILYFYNIYTSYFLRLRVAAGWTTLTVMHICRIVH